MNINIQLEYLIRICRIHPAIAIRVGEHDPHIAEVVFEEGLVDQLGACSADAALFVGEERFQRTASQVARKVYAELNK